MGKYGHEKTLDTFHTLGEARTLSVPITLGVSIVNLSVFSKIINTFYSLTTIYLF